MNTESIEVQSHVDRQLQAVKQAADEGRATLDKAERPQFRKAVLRSERFRKTVIRRRPSEPKPKGKD